MQNLSLSTSQFQIFSKLFRCRQWLFFWQTIVFDCQTILIKSRFSIWFSIMIWIKRINKILDKYFELWFTSYWKIKMINNLNILCELTATIIFFSIVLKTKRSMHFKFLYCWCQTLLTRSKSFKNVLNFSTIFTITNSREHFVNRKW